MVFLNFLLLLLFGGVLHNVAVVVCLNSLTTGTSVQKFDLFYLIAEILNDIGTGLFYQISGMVDDNVLNYQPTVQFFTLCIEILGKVSAYERMFEATPTPLVVIHKYFLLYMSVQKQPLSP